MVMYVKREVDVERLGELLYLHGGRTTCAGNAGARRRAGNAGARTRSRRTRTHAGFIVTLLFI